MGKSPGKWIKTTLFGKKISKFNLSKNVAPDKMFAAKAPVEDVSRNAPVIIDPHQLTKRPMANFELEKATSASPCDSTAVSNINRIVDSQSNVPSLLINDADATRLEQAATKTQAAFRGYMARRAFRALKGFITLQAFTRGHLVRRQAVSTLRCMQGIIRFQDLARGRKVKGSNSLFWFVKLARNIFIRKLLIILPTTMPLRLQYDVAEANSAWNWLERWSATHFWEPVKITNSKLQKKGTVHKPSTMSNIEKSPLTSFETDKSKCHQRKATSTRTESMQDELERIKCNLRKISASATAPPERLETETEKLVLVDEPLDRHPVLDNTCSMVDDEMSYKEEKSGKDDRIRKRRSLHAKHEGVENIAQNSQSIPSYMAATASAKAKLRALGSPRFGEGGADYGFTSRHSLPTSTNGKLSSASPRTQKYVQANGKGGSKMNRSLTSSRDGLLHDKMAQPVWRR